MQINLKIINICLILAVTAFMVATIVLAVQKSNLQADLDDLKEKLDYYESASEGALKPKSQRSLIDVLVKRERREETINYRLPNTMRPISYKLYLHPNLKTGNFSGQEVIIVDVQSATKQIILHSHKLIINNVYVRGPNDANLEIDSYSIDTVREFLVINMVKELRPNANIELGIIFEGTMIDKIVGLYSSTYSTPAMETRKIATSKFEPTYARQAFPCFDEPAMKAKFDITLVHPSGDKYHALSNMNELSTEFLGEYTETRFQPSVEMSTYVACFLVSDFAHKTKPINTQGIGENFNIRIYATEHQLDKVDFALDTGIAVTEYYIQYFKVEYPLPKLDMAAIPDFASNAMEHWGLLTYRETALLYDKTISSTYNKQRVAAVVSHELAHMWFGNLVTMKWWNDLWLNEGFARYIQYKGVNAAYPTWGMLDLFLIEALHSVMKFDASTASHPIVQPVETPDQITEIFDTISYEKGGSVIRMLENIVGSTKFEQAVTNYLNKFKYGNAETDDFLTEVAATNLDFDVKLMMRTWTEQMGYPVVEVKRIGNGKFNVTQKRFLSNIADYNLAFDDSPFDYKWMIPLTYATNDQNTYSPIWFDYNKANVEISVPSSVKWIKLNMQQVGYYRVNYEKDNWINIIDDLSKQPKTAFSIADRAHLLDDAFALADASQLDYSIALDMTVYLENENDFVPWFVAATKLLDLQRRLTVTEYQVDYLRYARQLLTKIYTEVGWTVDEDNHLKNRLRVTVLNAACSLGHPDCLDEAALRFNAWLTNPTIKPSPDLRETVYYYGMQRVNTQQAWEQMWELMVNEEDASEKLKLMYGLSAVRLPWILHRYAELAGNEENVRRQDYFTCLQNIAASPVGEPIIWDYVREQWPAMVERFGLNDRYLGRMISTITENFASQTKLEEMQNFFEKYPEAGAGTAARKQAIEKVKYNMQWLEQNKDEIGDWLQKYFEASQAIDNI